jgi:hypothetical protein
MKKVLACPAIFLSQLVVLNVVIKGTAVTKEIPLCTWGKGISSNPIVKVLLC